MRGGMKRKRGSALYLVLAFFLVLSALAATWSASFGDLMRYSAPSTDRARARAVAEAAWARARLSLARGESPGRAESSLLGGRSAVRARALGAGSWRVVVEGRVPSTHARGEVVSRLSFFVRVSDGVVRVTERVEEGA